MALPKLILQLVVLVAAVVAAPSGDTRDARRAVPVGWSLHRRADLDALVPLKFTLVQSNLDKLDAYLLDVADPQSPNYGKHWSPSEVAKTFQPSQESVGTVHSWLVNDHGIGVDEIQLSGNRDALHVNVTVAEAENILAAEYYVYRHDEAERERVGCHEGYSLPEHISKHVDIVSPTVHFGNSLLTRRDSSSSGSSAYIHVERESGASTIPISESQLDALGCDQAVTLDCLRDLYDFHYDQATANRSSIAVGEFEGNVFQQSDLDLFFGKYEPDQVGHAPTTINIETGSFPGPTDLGEATLDFELALGLLGPKQEVFLYQVGETNPDQDPVDELLGALDASFCSVDGVSDQGLTDCGDVRHTKVVSLSYHFSPDYNDPTIIPVVTRWCTEIGKLTLTGITFVASSGDSGVSYGTGQHGCLVANGTLVNGNPVGSFVGQLPASCPYVTAVGATSVSPGNSVRDPETATTDFPSGGGFSNAFARPAFQEAAVSNYLEKFVPSYAPDIYNRSGRGYPDVAANGFPIAVAVGGSFSLSGGTSASAPIFASVVTAINDARAAVGKGPVGWINPAIYSPIFAHAFNDITNGTNPGCQTEGFVAAPGWDPVTGLGTPNFPRLLEAFLALP